MGWKSPINRHTTNQELLNKTTSPLARGWWVGPLRCGGSTNRQSSEEHLITMTKINKKIYLNIPPGSGSMPALLERRRGPRIIIFELETTFNELGFTETESQRERWGGEACQPYSRPPPLPVSARPSRHDCPASTPFSTITRSPVYLLSTKPCSAPAYVSSGGLCEARPWAAYHRGGSCSHPLPR